jgi:hypothetical protein
MEFQQAAKRGASEGAKGCASGCVTHFLIALAGVILLGGGAHFWGLSGKIVFVIVLAVIFLVSVAIPWAK